MISLSIVVICGLLASLVTYQIGEIMGRKNERMRIVRLCNQVFEDRMSGSVRRVLNGIFENRTKLMSEEEFFGPDGKEHPNHISHMVK